MLRHDMIDGNIVVELLRSYGKEYLPHIVIGVISQLFARFLWFYPPVVIGVVFDAVLLGDEAYQLPGVPATFVPPGRIDLLWFSAGLIIAVYAFGHILSTLSNLSLAYTAYNIQHKIRVNTYDHTQQLGYHFFDNKQKGELISILNNDINQIETFFNNTITLIGNVVFILTVIGSYMFILNWQLTIVALLAPLIVGIINYIYSRRISPKYDTMRENVGDISSKIENNISGIGVIKAYTQEKYELSRLEESSTNYSTVSWSILRAKVLFGQGTEALSNFGYVLILVVGGLWVINGSDWAVFTGELAAGTLLTFLMFNNRFSWPLTRITEVIDKYQEMRASSKRVFGLLDEDPEIKDSGDVSEVSLANPDIAFDDVSFRYEGGSSDAVSDIHFSVPHGETVGIVGPTGAGKSTILKLLFRFYDVDRGSITVNGTDVRNIPVKDYRELYGYVSQDPYLFDGTVEENIVYGNPEADRQEVIEAAKVANAHTFISELDEGYDTNVGEGGSKLSGGQRQRIAIARAVVGNPPMLVLDEPTSHVDNATEILLQDGLAEISKERTTFVVAHNLSTVRNADQIIALEDGTISEYGTHEELTESEGLYNDLWRIQTGEYEHASSLSRMKVSD